MLVIFLLKDGVMHIIAPPMSDPTMNMSITYVLFSKVPYPPASEMSKGLFSFNNGTKGIMVVRNEKAINTGI